MVRSNCLQENIGNDATNVAKESSERTGEHGSTRLRGKETTRPNSEETSWDQYDPGQLRGKKAKLVMKLIMGDKIRLRSSHRDEQASN